MTKLKHFAFSFALAGALAFGMGTVTKAAEPASGTTITAPAAKTDKPRRHPPYRSTVPK